MPSSLRLSVTAWAVLLLSSTVSSLPALHGKHGSGNVPGSPGAAYKVGLVKNPGFTPSGPAAYAKALNKFSSSIDDDVSDFIASLMGNNVVDDAAAGSETGTVVATPILNDNEYLCPVQIGTPAQTVHMDFDTGSSDFWVFTTQTSTDEVNGQTLYNPDLSSTAALMPNATWSIGYGDGSTSSGDVYQDTVSIGAVTVTKQAVESAEDVSFSFTRDALSSGLLGLGFGGSNTVIPQIQRTFFENAMASLPSAVLTANLKRNAAGNYNFGYIDPAEYTGEIGYAPIDSSNGYWRFASSGFAVAGGEFNTTNIDAIADTGTTLLLLPDDIVTAYYSQVPGAQYGDDTGAWTFACNTALPDFTFGLASGYRGVIPGRYMNYTADSASQCYGGMQSNFGLPFALFGDILLKAQFVVFDYGNTRIGFAAKEL